MFFYTLIIGAKKIAQLVKLYLDYRENTYISIKNLLDIINIKNKNCLSNYFRYLQNF